MIRQIEPWIDEVEIGQLNRIAETTYVTEGPLTDEFEARFREITGAKHAIAYVNGTMAQFAILKAIGVGVGDEVIVPAMTFIATCNAVLLAGARPVLCDIDRDRIALDPTLLPGLITERTKAIIPVHLYGGMADIEAIKSIADSRGIAIVEDAAQAVGVRYGGRHAGTFGVAGYLSFYGNKTMTTGEGAIILVDDPGLAEACYRLKNHGRKEKGTFIHDQVGFNFSFTDLHAAIGLAQIAKLPEIIKRKRSLYENYRDRLGKLNGVSFQEYPAGVKYVPWFTNIFVEDAAALSDFLAEREIGSRRFFYPLHRQPCYSVDLVELTPCPESDWAFEHGLSLPSTVTLSEAEMDLVCSSITKFCARSSISRSSHIREA